MDSIKGEQIGYLRYYGDAVESGCLDARKAADALQGFDEALRYLLYKEDPYLKTIDFEFPVRIQEGSWEIVVPENINSLITLAGGTAVVLTTYFAALAAKAASDGVLESGPVKDLKKTVIAAMKAFRKIVEIAKYCGELGQQTHNNVKVIQDGMVEITREGLPLLIIHHDYYKLYAEAPATLLCKVASVIEVGREMEIAADEDGVLVKTQVSTQEKRIFIQEKENSSDIVLPELEDGQHVQLEGEVTRCTETANTIGLCYKGHVLTCKPRTGSILPFKPHIISKTDDHIFTPVEIRGVVVREAIDGHYKDKKPHIVFDEIIPSRKSKPNGIQPELDLE